MANDAEKIPEILAPAGDVDCFLAALAAGADAIYLGLKNFSARMEAENFGLGELARLVELAHEHSCRVYVAMNTLIKPGEAEQAFRLIARLAAQVYPDGLIVQDPGMPDIARQAGFGGSIAFSTLANISDAIGLRQAAALGASRVILPRELSLDEMRLLGDCCPPGLDLECFVHGALCYCVSGRCYWSSYMGGKSGLRGRCVQPCRRLYATAAPVGRNHRLNKTERARSSGKPERFFSCQDLEIGALTRQLLTIPKLVSWKIEGRKKGPHYVFHTVTGYRMLRDNPGDAQVRKTALEILEMALGRPGVTARFLPQKKYFPMSPGKQTSSGLLAGVVRTQPDGVCTLKPRFDLQPNDFLRLGVEDEKWHATFPVKKRVPKGGSLNLPVQRHKTPKSGVPVFLIDRREPELQNLLAQWRDRLRNTGTVRIREVRSQLVPPHPAASKIILPDMIVGDALPLKRGRSLAGIWLNGRKPAFSRTVYPKTVFWLPPVIWPDREDVYKREIRELWRSGARNFVCNAPWQRGFFPDSLPEDANLVAGPFCNAANAFAIQAMATLGYRAVIASPELAAADFMELAARSPLPLGCVLAGFWPVGLSRFGLAGINVGEPFASPRGEVFWAADRGGTIWIYPAWSLNLEEKRDVLRKAGFSFFVQLETKMPPNVPRRDRPGLFNWDGRLL